ncbi:MAG: hypothetical protein WD024_06360 [Bacillota bacterium]
MGEELPPGGDRVLATGKLLVNAKAAPPAAAHFFAADEGAGNALSQESEIAGAVLGPGVEAGR